MLKVYVDESGNLGRNKGYFVIAMIFPHNPNRLKNIIREFCARHSLIEVHATELDFPQKQFLINKLIRQTDYEIHYIVLDKTQVKNTKLYKNNNLLFNYLFSLLVKDFVISHNRDICFILDNRTVKVASLNSLADYIKIKAFTEWGHTKEIKLEYRDSKDSLSLQVSDLVANSIWRRYYWNLPDFYNKLNIVKSIQFPHNLFRYNIYRRK